MIFRSQVAQNFKFPGASPWTPLGAAYRGPPEPLYIAGGEGASGPSLRTPAPAVGPRASARSFVPLPVRDKISPPPQQKNVWIDATVMNHCYVASRGRIDTRAGPIPRNSVRRGAHCRTPDCHCQSKEWAFTGASTTITKYR